MSTTIVIPEFDFSGFYYGRILESLIVYKRQNVPEHTDESAYDPLMQLLRATALVGHLNNVLIDLVANESTLPTANLTESVRNMLRLIDYELASATPAVTDVVYELSKVFTAAFEVVNEGALAATELTETAASVYFEMLAALTIDPTDEFSHVFGLEDSVFTDHTTEANSPTTPADDFFPWSTPAAGDMIYFGHKQIMWDQLNLWFTVPVQGEKAEGSITCVPKAGLLNGETFVIDDGINPAVTFYFDVTGAWVPGGGYDDTNIEVDVSGDTTDSDVAITVAAAIMGAPTLNIYAVPLSGALDHIVRVQNTVGGSHGNVAMSETVNDGTFAVSGLSGGNDDTLAGVWEYYDGDWTKVAPTSVDKTHAIGQLLVELNTLLGTSERTGATVRVQLNETTAYEELTSLWGDPSGAWAEDRNYVLTTGLLGQTTPSEIADDYSVGSDWSEFTNLDDGTAELTADGAMTFDLPQTVTENWIETEVDGYEAYWIRFRIIEVGSITIPVFRYGRLDMDKQYVLVVGTQGRTQAEELGTSDGSANQRYETSQDNYIDDSLAPTVGVEEWIVVDNFLSSLPTDKHCIVELGEDDRATLVFGDGVTGKIPPNAEDIAAEYRFGANLDGNVGADTVVVNKSGLTYVNSVWNPRAAAGWAEAQGASEESLERAKILGPASLRTRPVAVGPGDVEQQTLDFTAADGSKPYSRARAFEEGFGPKTIEVVVVVKGGGQATTAQLEELDEWFNGDPWAHPPVEKHLVANQEVTAVNYTQKTIDITATVYGNVTAAAIRTRLSQIFQPEALKEDGVTYEWEFGGKVPSSRIAHEIFKTDDSITDVDITEVNGVTPPADMDVTLAARELPALGTATITVVG